MKKIFLICFLVVFSLTTGSFLGKYISHYNVLGQEIVQIQTLPSPTPTPTPTPIEVIPSTPMRIEVTKIGIDAAVELVGLDSGGKMGVPEGIENVGWYSLGVKPGEKGNAVIDGHLDTIAGAPAIFYNLSKLESGDLITVTDYNNKKFVFKVVNKQIYPFDKFPIEEIFGSSDKSRLNLITCEGYFDARSQNYSHRTVIYSELIETI